jgi:Fe-S cluster assembly scaffold protein SufB
MADMTLNTVEGVGAFTRDQAEILSTRRTEPGWLREQRLAAQQLYAETPMPTTQPEEWRYTPIAELLKLEALGFADEARPVAGTSELPAALLRRIEAASAAAGRVVQLDASAVWRELDAGLAAQGVVLSSLDQAVR